MFVVVLLQAINVLMPDFHMLEMNGSGVRKTVFFSTTVDDVFQWLLK